MFRLTGMYAPHESKYLKKDVKNGDYTNTGGGYRANMEWEHNADWGKVTSLAGYQFEENKIEHESDNQLTWRYSDKTLNFVSDAIDWVSTAPGTRWQNAIMGGTVPMLRKNVPQR
nr:hypothetical protein [Erwinia rhapontici]